MGGDKRLKKELLLALIVGLVIMLFGYGGLYYWYCW